MRRLLCTVALAVVLPIPLGATAATSTYGNNFTQDQNLKREVMACDGEADSHGVRGDYVPNGTGSTYTIYDGNGSGNSCAHTGVFSQKIYKHRVVEVRTAQPDGVGAWAYP